MLVKDDLIEFYQLVIKEIGIHRQILSSTEDEKQIRYSKGRIKELEETKYRFVIFTNNFKE